MVFKMVKGYQLSVACTSITVGSEVAMRDLKPINALLDSAPDAVDFLDIRQLDFGMYAKMAGNDAPAISNDPLIVANQRLKAKDISPGANMTSKEYCGTKEYGTRNH